MRFHFVHARIFLALAIVVAFSIAPAPAHADTLADRAGQLADAAFVMLNSLNNAEAGKYSGGPLLAPTAELASNAQALASAVKSGDTSGARHAMAAIVRDQGTIEPLTNGISPTILAEWGSLKTQIALVQKEVPPEQGAPPSIPAASEPPAESPPPVGSAPVSSHASAPQIVIDKRTSNPEDDSLTVHGFIQGTDLKDAGIYQGGRKLKDIEVASVHGEQRLNFTFKINDPEPDQYISATDIEGRQASASITGDSSAPSLAPPASEAGGASEAGVAPEAGEAPTIGGSDSSTAEISPSGGPELSPEPTRRLTELGNVQINIAMIRRSPTATNEYEVSGQIVGNVTRAGIYAGGRMIKQIPLIPGGFSNFDVTFSRLGRKNIAIRAYGPGSDFVEQPLAPGAGISTFSNARPSSPYPYGAAP
ncbi:MAG TPA: hypothetical protein VMA09_10475 [Candidatus Binataceae bacterium]|nr:hypothetical protein [Candidatus Binataceae bacterium]